MDTERGTGAPAVLRSEEELREDEELDQVTFEYIEALLSGYRVVDVSDGDGGVLAAGPSGGVDRDH